MKPLAGICAAGNSERMGFDKLSTPPTLHSPDTLLSRAVSVAHGLDTVVALPPETHPYFQARLAQLKPHDRHISIPESDRDFSGTLRALAQYALDNDYSALALVMADMPFVTKAHLDALVTVFNAFEGTRIVQAMSQGFLPGYPVIFPRSVLKDFDTLQKDEDIKGLIDRHGAKRLEIPSEAPVLHVETPADWRQM